MDNTRKMSAKCLLILSVEIILFLMDLPMLKLIKLAKMAGVMHEADHAYSIQEHLVIALTSYQCVI